MADILSLAQLTTDLQSLPGWGGDVKQIEKNYQKKDFKAALAFVNKIGGLAEAADHHPDIFLHGWNKIRVTLSTHSAGGVTKNDINLARQIEEIAPA